MLAFLTAMAAAQAPAPKPTAAKPAAAPAARRPTGTLAQIMRGIYFPNANLIYDVQQNDPGAPKKKSDGSGSSTDTYCEHVLRLGDRRERGDRAHRRRRSDPEARDARARTASRCPLQQADFQKFARNMRAAGRVALQAARTRNQEKVSDATNNIADACVGCHEVYRDKGPADSPARCTPPPKP